MLFMDSLASFHAVLCDFELKDRKGKEASEGNVAREDGRMK